VTTWRVLSVQQPWAGALIAGIKDVENRSWTTAHRGPLLIHASARPDWEAPAWAWTAAGLTPPPADGRPARKHLAAVMPLGAVLGSAVLRGIVTGSTSRWAEPGHYHWLLGDPEPWPLPVPAAGKLGLWTWET
jgi:ASCH domain